MKLKVKLVVLILIAGMLVSSAVWASRKSPASQMVIFINSNPITVLGLIKFVVNEKNEPIDYVILNKRWDGEKKVLWLKPGYYGVTQYYPEFDRVINYYSFWVKDKPILIEM